MIGIDPVTLVSMAVLAGYTPKCPVHEPTQINVVPVTKKVKYDYSKGIVEVQNERSDTVDPYSFHGKSITQAYMKGSVGVGYDMNFSTVKMPKARLSCVWYKDINVTISIDPTIVVAREVYQDPCMRDAVIGHELKHVRVDRVIVNKYAKVIGQKLMKELKSRGFTAGPFYSEREEEIRQKMFRVVQQIISHEELKMGIERSELQREVDTLEEYTSVDAKCPLFQEKKERIYSDLLR